VTVKYRRSGHDDSGSQSQGEINKNIWVFSVQKY
jgi:hypothetical protein